MSFCKRIFLIPATIGVLLGVSLIFSDAATAETVSLGSLDVSKVKQGWGEPHADKSVEGNQISIGKKKFEHGLGTHAESTLIISLKGGSEHLSAYVGVDDEVGDNPGSVEFRVLGDDRELWKSKVMRAGQEPEKVDVDLKGCQTLQLLVTDADDGIGYDHADWADATIEYSGKPPYAVDKPDEPVAILTPKAPDSPRINGAKVFGVRPGSPFMYTIAASGQRPMTFAAEGLPEGLTLDPQTGRITGTLQNRGEYAIVLRAENAVGKARREFKIVCGDTISLTPPMGWNSWNCFCRRSGRRQGPVGRRRHGPKRSD